MQNESRVKESMNKQKEWGNSWDRVAANCELETNVGPERARIREAMIARKKEITKRGGDR